MSLDPPTNSPYRALLTDTLPFELPIVFSNENYFDSIRENISDAGLASALKKLRPPVRRFTKPYQYNISKGVGHSRNLYLVHPLLQLEMCSFYERYHGTIIYSCAKSHFSLRRPVRLARPFVASVSSEPDAGFKDGGVELEGDGAEAQPPLIRSYFRYAGYEPLGAFRESAEFVRLEKRFARLRQLDVAKCFSNIYTHSVAWAIKGKELSKSSAGSHSFENEFDKLMQRANYNETNGIPIGPEISRVFSEIIFQDIDEKVLARLTAANMQAEWDYAVRRYIDDFHIFANTIDQLDYIQQVICEELEKYKLYINEQKTRDELRPFVSDITAAQLELRASFRSVGRYIRNIGTIDPGIIALECADACNELRNVRIIVGRNKAPPSAVSGWLLAAILKSVRRLFDMSEVWIARGAEQALSDLLAELLDLTFYLCAVDSRVRPSYRLGQILNDVHQNIDKLEAHSQDRLRHILTEELIGLTRREMVTDKHLSEKTDNVELYNYLICGSLFVGEDFLANKTVKDAIGRLTDEKSLTYFRYVTAKVCMLRGESGAFEAQLKELNDGVERRLLGAKGLVDVDSEIYLLLCDFISAPDIDEARKRGLFNALLGGTLSKEVMANLIPRVGFVDWAGVNVEHLLKRRQLRALYD
jgi:hypothetical protein